MLVASSGRIVSLGGLLMASMLAVTTVVFVDARPAAADPDCEVTRDDTGRLDQSCDENQSGQEGSHADDDGGSEPACDLSLAEGYGREDARTWCEGENACWANVPSIVYPTRDTWPDDPPSEDAIYIYKECIKPNGDVAYSEWTWYVPDEPSIQEIAMEAYGNLEAPDFTLAFSPPGESVVFIDTWWWADGAPDENLKGTAALGVAAVAEPDHMEVDPGDGSGTITCDFVTSESDACTHVYEKASDGDGYTARARLIYDVHFEQNGETFQVTNAPDTFETDWIEATVPVTEVQATVVR